MAEPTELVKGTDIAVLFTIEPGLEEDRVWSANVLPLLADLPRNNIEIWQLCVTEMVNNTLDHAQGSTLTVIVGKGSSKTRVQVLDDGVGIFRKIKAAFNLEDETQAILELAKGKLTTDPDRHSG